MFLYGLWEQTQKDKRGLRTTRSGQRASFGLLPWPCVAVVAARAGVADHGSLQRPGPREVSVSRNTLCHGPPCTCAESGGNPPYPAGRRGGTKKWINVLRSREKSEERILLLVMCAVLFSLFSIKC